MTPTGPKSPNAEAAMDRVVDRPSSPDVAGVIHQNAGWARAIPFGEVGRYTQRAVVSAAMNLGLPVLLHEWVGIAERVAVALALTTAFVVNFLVARSYVFKASQARP